MISIKKPYVLCIIPARSGSKRLPGKNLRMLRDKPLIGHTISTAQNSSKIDSLIVSTDCKKIKKVAVDNGANVPFLRPKKLAQDNSTREDVLKHAVKYFEKINKISIDIIVLLQVTNPFTSVYMIDECVTNLIEEEWDTTITVTEVQKRAEWIGIIEKNNQFQHIIKKTECSKLNGKQEFSPSGNVYAIKKTKLFACNKIILGKTPEQLSFHPYMRLISTS